MTKAHNSLCCFECFNERAVLRPRRFSSFSFFFFSFSIILSKVSLRLFVLFTSKRSEGWIKLTTTKMMILTREIVPFLFYFILGTEISLYVRDSVL